MNPVQILLIEDQAGDILLTRHVLAEHLVPVKVHAAMDGQQAAGMLADPSPAMNCWRNANCGMSQ